MTNTNTNQNLGNGIDSTINGDTLTLIIKLSRPGTPSASGKTLVLASTRGNVTIPGTDITIGLNVYTRK